MELKTAKEIINNNNISYIDDITHESMEMMIIEASRQAFYAGRKTRFTQNSRQFEFLSFIDYLKIVKK